MNKGKKEIFYLAQEEDSFGALLVEDAYFKRRLAFHNEMQRPSYEKPLLEDSASVKSPDNDFKRFTEPQEESEEFEKLGASAPLKSLQGLQESEAEKKAQLTLLYKKGVRFETLAALDSGRLKLVIDNGKVLNKLLDHGVSFHITIALELDHIKILLENAEQICELLKKNVSSEGNVALKLDRSKIILIKDSASSVSVAGVFYRPVAPTIVLDSDKSDPSYF